MPRPVGPRPSVDAQALAQPRSPATPPVPLIALVAELAVVLASCLVVLRGLAPTYLLTDSFPIGTDSTGHAVGIWIDIANPASILPGGWSGAMFGGYPANQLYPPLANAIAALLASVVPLAVALKLITVLPVVLLPLAAYAAARLASLRGALPPAIAAAMVPFVYDTSCGICGGNISSVIHGEYAYSWGLLFGLLTLGCVDRLLRTGRGPILTTLLAVAAAWSHPVTAAWVLVGALVLTAFRRREWWPVNRRSVGLSALAATMISALWWLPFLWRHEWMPLLGFSKRTDYFYWLLPASPLWEVTILALSVLGVVTAVRRRQIFLVAVALSSALAGLLFVLIPDGSQLFNLRVLPFWYMGRWILAAVGICLLVDLALSRLAIVTLRPWRAVAAPVVILVMSVLVVGTTWGWWAVAVRADSTTSGRSSLLGIEIPPQTVGADEVFAGFESRPDAPALASLRTLLVDAATDLGCGRLAWDIGADSDTGEPTFGDENVLWQTPLWTAGCIAPITGIYVDSSATAPSAFGAASLVSPRLGIELPSIPQYTYDLQVGVERLRTMGVRYYLTQGEAATSEATSLTDQLTRRTSTGSWTLWEVTENSLVSELAHEPVVVSPRVSDGGWDDLTMEYGQSNLYDSVALAQDGPAGWARVAPGLQPPALPTSPAGIHDIETTDDTISFSVAEVGRPVLVRVSAYPGWSVEGAPALYRASPNFYLVVPAQARVTLTHGKTPLDVVAIAAGLTGLALMAAMALTRRKSHN